MKESLNNSKTENYENASKVSTPHAESTDKSLINDTLESTAFLLSSLKNFSTSASWFAEKKTWRQVKRGIGETDESTSYAKSFENVINGCDKKKLFQLFTAESTPHCEVSMVYPFNISNLRDNSISSTTSSTQGSAPVEYIEVRGGRACVEFMSHEFQAVPDVMIQMTDSKLFVNDQDTTSTILCSFTLTGTRTQNVSVSGEYSIGSSKNSLFNSKYGLHIAGNPTTTAASSVATTTAVTTTPASTSVSSSSHVSTTSLIEKESVTDLSAAIDSGCEGDSSSFVVSSETLKGNANSLQQHVDTDTETTAEQEAVAVSVDMTENISSSIGGTTTSESSIKRNTDSSDKLDNNCNDATNNDDTTASEVKAESNTNNPKKRKRNTAPMINKSVLIATKDTKFSHIPLLPSVVQIGTKQVGTIKFYLDGDKKIFRMEVLNSEVHVVKR